MSRLLPLLTFIMLPVTGVVAQPAPVSELDSRPSLAVVGMLNEVEDDAWRDARVGLGLQTMLSQLLFETGAFMLLEEKTVVRDELRTLATGIWAMGREGRDMDPVIAQLEQFEPDFAAYGRIIYFGTPRSSFTFGGLHRRTESTEIRVEVTLHDLGTGEQYRGRGKGVSKTTASSALFTFREDNVAFDVSNVGNATKEALAQAVEEIMIGLDDN